MDIEKVIKKLYGFNKVSNNMSIIKNSNMAKIE
jgi:hypothetical protein